MQHQQSVRVRRCFRQGQARFLVFLRALAELEVVVAPGQQRRFEPRCRLAVGVRQKARVHSLRSIRCQRSLLPGLQVDPVALEQGHFPEIIRYLQLPAYRLVVGVYLTP